VIVVLLIGAAVVWFPSLRPNPEHSRACNAPGPAQVTTEPTNRSLAEDASAGANHAET